MAPRKKTQEQSKNNNLHIKHKTLSEIFFLSNVVAPKIDRTRTKDTLTLTLTRKCFEVEGGVTLQTSTN